MRNPRLTYRQKQCLNECHRNDGIMRGRGWHTAEGLPTCATRTIHSLVAKGLLFSCGTGIFRLTEQGTNKVKWGETGAPIFESKTHGSSEEAKKAQREQHAMMAKLFGSDRDARIAEADEDERLLGFDQYTTTGSMEGR